MKVFIAVAGNNGLDSNIADRFGRATGFLIYNTQTKEFSSIDNIYKDDVQGVGIKIAGLVLEKGCRAVIGAQPGPKAMDILQKAGIIILIANQGTALQALEKFQSELSE